ncbi:unnamed protein product, partial [Mesorhabditis spiculigera]
MERICLGGSKPWGTKTKHSTMLRTVLFLGILATVSLANSLQGQKGIPFLSEASKKHKREFSRIVKNKHLTKGEVKAKTEQWAATIGGLVENLYKQFVEDMGKWKEEVAQNRTALLNTIPGEFEKLQNMYDDMNITKGQERKMVKQYLKGLKRSNRNLHRVMRAFSKMKFDWRPRVGKLGRRWIMSPAKKLQQDIPDNEPELTAEEIVPDDEVIEALFC